MVDEAHEQQPDNAVGDCEIGQVEGQLQRRLTAMQRERDGGTGDHREHHHQRRREEESDHEWQLTQREGVSIAAELNVDDEDLGGAEQRNEDPPGDLTRRRNRVEMGHDLDQQKDRGRHQHDGQKLDAMSPPARSGVRRVALRR
jgi:hypothetical protein